MNKIKSLQAKADQITETLVALDQLFLDISFEDVKPSGYAKTVKEILALPTAPSEKICDIDMLKELKRLHLESVEVDDEQHSNEVFRWGCDSFSNHS
jgi:hypothetical protein